MSSRLLKNIGFVYIFQLSNVLVPLVTLPYLTRTLGVNGFGALGFSAGIAALMVLIVDWGFSLTAVQEAAQARDSRERLGVLASNVALAKLLLTGACAIGLLAAIIISPTLRAYSGVLLASCAQVLGSLLSMSWLLQGCEDFRSFTAISVVVRVLTIPATLLLVRSPDDIIFAALIPSLASIAVSLASIVASAKFVHLERWPALAGAVGQIRNGWDVFVSTGAIYLYTQVNVVLLGMLSNTNQVGLFAGAERIRRAAALPLSPLSTAIFPRINNLLVSDAEKAYGLMNRMLIVQGAATLFISVVVYVAAPLLVTLVLGPGFEEAITTVRIMAPITFLVGLSNVLGINMMLPLGLKSAMSKIFAVSAVLNLGMMAALSAPLGCMGAGLSALIAELWVTTAMLVLVRTRRLYKMPAMKVEQLVR